MSVLRAVEGKLLLLSVLDSRNHLTRLSLCSSAAAAHHYTTIPATPNSPGVDSCADEEEAQNNDK